MSTSPHFMSTAEVAEFLGVTASTLKRWRAEGTGPAYSTFGRNIRYPIPAVREYLEANTVRPGKKGGGPSSTRGGVPAAQTRARSAAEQGRPAASTRGAAR